MVVDNGCKLRLRFVVDDRVILWFIRLWVVIDWLLFYLLNNKIKKRYGCFKWIGKYNK